MLRGLLLSLMLFVLAVPADARQVEFATNMPASGTLVVPLSSSEDLNALALPIGGDRERLVRVLKQEEFGNGYLETISVPAIGPYRQVVIVGMGEEKLTSFEWQEVGGTAAQALQGSTGSVAFLGTKIDANALANVALGVRIGGYTFDKYHSDRDDEEAPLVIVATDSAAMAQYKSEQMHMANGVALTRDLINEPANVIYPETFIDRVRAAFAGVPNVTIDVLDVPAMRRLGMGSLLAVGQGSKRPPRMLVVRYRGATDAPRVAIAGKGITFDTGGTSIKPSSGMWAMKGDMAGAAATIGAVYSLAKSKAPVDVIGIAALAENMPGATATRPGDVVRAMNGKTIEILNTDAEGRLVLADAIAYAEKQFRPSAIVDIATLTGSVGRALGSEYAGLLTDSEMMAKYLMAAGKKSGETLWRLPLNDTYAAELSSDIADVRNISTGSAPGASIGGHFLRHFVEDTPWAHLDIAGVDNVGSSRPTVPAGYVGFGVRLLDRFVRDFSKASR